MGFSAGYGMSLGVFFGRHVSVLLGGSDLKARGYGGFAIFFGREEIDDEYCSSEDIYE